MENKKAGRAVNDETINVYEYTDYHKLMRDLWLREKRVNKDFSHRYMADRLGVRSSAFFQNTVAGRKKLSEKILPRVCSLFNLDRSESEYFRLLVAFNQADEISEKKEHLEKIAEFFKSRTKLPGPHQFEFYRKWYLNAIRTLLGFYSFSGDFKELATALDPYIRVNQARDALDILEGLGWATKDGSGYLPSEPETSAGGADDLTRVAANEFQHIMGQMGLDAIDRFESTEREFSSITVGLSGGVYKAVLRELAGMRERILELASRDHAPDRVYHLNLQLFPLSRNLADFGVDPEELAARRRAEREAARAAAETSDDDEEIES